MRKCGATCLHKRFVQGYREERQRQEAVADEAACGYRTELIDYLSDNPLITFKQWLIGHKRAEEQ